jgi:hypothetical protein
LFEFKRDWNMTRKYPQGLAQLCVYLRRFSEKYKGKVYPFPKRVAVCDRNEAVVLPAELLRPYQLWNLQKAGGGADIGPLRDQGTLLIGLLPDSQKYFIYHHTEADVFEAVDKRELELGAAGMAALVYLLDQEGIQ